ncbi:hypothetical protein ACQEU6_19335 [Spirillospora sp. CA-108201]
MTTGHPNPFAAKLRELLDARADLSQNKLAKLVPCNPGHLSKIINGHERPSERIRQTLDDLLDADGTLAALVPPPAPRRKARKPAPVTLTGTDIPDDWDDMERRRLLQMAALGIGAGTLGIPPESLGRFLDLFLTSEPRTYEDWEIACADHLYGIRTRPPHEVHKDLLIDLISVRRQMETSPDSQPELHRVRACLATLNANVLTRLGEHGSAIRWWRTARSSAESSGDLGLQLLVRGSEAGFGLYGQRHPETVLRLTKTAREIAGINRTVGLANILSSEAKALSLLGRHKEANRVLLELEEFSPGIGAANPIPNYWTGDQVYFTRSWVHSYAGEESKANDARDLVLAENGDYQYVANVNLHRAVCTVVNGGLKEGLSDATELLNALPKANRSHMIADTGNRVLNTVPVKHHGSPQAKDLRAVMISSVPERPKMHLDE